MESVASDRAVLAYNHDEEGALDGEQLISAETDPDVYRACHFYEMRVCRPGEPSTTFPENWLIRYLRITTRSAEAELRQIPIQDEIYRVGKEALVNAFCHSGAKRIDLELEYTDTNLIMRIRDNGCGIDPQMLDAGRPGHW